MSVPTAELNPHQHVNRVGQLPGEIGDARVERHDVRAQGGHRREHGAEDAGIDDRLTHRS